MILESLFFISLCSVIYTYLGYPLYLWMLTKILPQRVNKSVFFSLPFVSVVIAAKNEALNIERRIKNLLGQDYPQEKLEIFIVSDGSDDDTLAIVRFWANKQSAGQARIVCHEYQPAKGKPSALNFGVKNASGDIIVFADARQSFESSAISELVQNFADPEVGGVSGELVFIKDGESNIKAQMGAYWKYEKTVRKMESETGSVVGATGAIYAIRKRLYQLLPSATLLDDVLTPMNITMQGYRVVFDSQAIAYDVVSENVSQEWNRKVRTLAGNWQLLSLKPALLNPMANKQWFRFCSHKLARVFVPFLLIIILVTSAFLREGMFYLIIFWMQVAIYLCALLVNSQPKLQKITFLNFIYFFCVLNLACLAGFWGWISGNTGKTWNK